MLLKIPILKSGDLTIKVNRYKYVSSFSYMLWQPLDTQGLMISLTSKPQRGDIMWDIHKRTRQGALVSYLYKTVMVHATNNLTCPIVHAPSLCLSHVLLKATPCVLHVS